jgi:hypothetical protein
MLLRRIAYLYHIFTVVLPISFLKSKLDCLQQVSVLSLAIMVLIFNLAK